MEINSFSPKSLESRGILSRAYTCVFSLPRNLWLKLVNIAEAAKKLAKDDPRKVVHPIKVGIALTLVCLFYYLHPLYSTLGLSAMWAVLTVVVVFEFSVGATIGKGTNRMVATCLAGGLGVGVHHLADLSGNPGEPIVLFLCVFFVGYVMTFVRFFPKVKARYDYGFLIFILTFVLVAVSGYRDDEVFMIALNRLKTIVVGCCITILVCTFVCPVWSGAELHNLVSSNIEKLGTFLEAFGGEFFQVLEDIKGEDNKSSLISYKSILDNKTNLETMANQAKWEPRHGKFKFRHPWKQYIKIGNLTRQCAYKIDALSNHLQSDYKAEVADNFKKACIRVSSEAGKALIELSYGMKKMKRSSVFVTVHVKESKSAAEELRELLQSTGFIQGFNLLELMPVATVVTLLIEIMTCTKQIAEAVNELASMANFKAVDSLVVPAEVLVLLPMDEFQEVTKVEVDSEDHQDGLLVACS